MPKFFYIVSDKSKKKVRGFEEANTQDELIARLQSRDLVVISVASEAKEEGVKAQAGIGFGKASRLKFKRNRVSADDLVLFCRQLATLLGAGVTILKSLEIISQQVSSRKLHAVLKQLQANMEQGLSLHEAMSKHPQVFSDLWVNLVESGEAGGSLAVVLARLASYLERMAAFKKKIMSALMYPCILMLAGLSALLFLTIKIIPTFAELFKSFNIKLPLLTVIIMNLSNFIKRFILVIAGVLIAAFYLFKQYTRAGDGRMRFENFKFKLPVFGEFFKALVVERFSSNMATLLESGVPILYSLEITEHSVDNLVMADIIRQVKEDVRAGRSLSQPLDKSGFFEPMVTQMVAIGEEIGELSPMLKKINA
ncbi:MAG: type II secretion system F family protein, partial [Candidatus Omnitrophota bacterium]